MGKLIFASSLSWFLGGKFHSSRTAKKLKAKFQKEQKQLYSQYYNDVYKLSEQNQELQLYVEQLKDALQTTEAKHELEALQRDYDEFKQPDIDGDDRISRAEFNMYVKNYLSHYPGLTEKDYPKFEDFDHDNDGRYPPPSMARMLGRMQRVSFSVHEFSCLCTFPSFFFRWWRILQVSYHSKNTRSKWRCKPKRPKRMPCTGNRTRKRKH